MDYYLVLRFLYWKQYQYIVSLLPADLSSSLHIGKENI
nr:MAG TPA: hypothetical protein [Caudoviricetes sp.]